MTTEHLLLEPSEISDCTSFLVLIEKVKMAFSSNAKSDVQFTVLCVCMKARTSRAASARKSLMLSVEEAITSSRLSTSLPSPAFMKSVVIVLSMSRLLFYALACPPGRASEDCTTPRLFDFRD